MTDLTPGTVDALLAKAQAVVDALADEEANHGGLVSRETLNIAGRLRLELSVWKGGAAKTRDDVLSEALGHLLALCEAGGDPFSEPGRPIVRFARSALAPSPKGSESSGRFEVGNHPQSRANAGVSPGESTMRKSTLRGERADG